MKADFTIAELWQIATALNFQLQCCEDDKDDPLVKSFVKELNEVRDKVEGLIRGREVQNDDRGL